MKISKGIDQSVQFFSIYQMKKEFFKKTIFFVRNLGFFFI